MTSEQIYFYLDLRQITIQNKAAFNLAPTNFPVSKSSHISHRNYDHFYSIRIRKDGTLHSPSDVDYFMRVKINAETVCVCYVSQSYIQNSFIQFSPSLVSLQGVIISF